MPNNILLYLHRDRYTRAGEPGAAVRLLISQNPGIAVGWWVESAVKDSFQNRCTLLNFIARSFVKPPPTRRDYVGDRKCYRPELPR